MATKGKTKKLGDTLVDGDVLKVPHVTTPNSPWIEDRLHEPQAAAAPLLPPRWWEEPRTTAAAPMQRADPILTISPQVAQVLNMGIDRLVDVTTRLRGDYEFAQDTLNRYRWNDERIRTFLGKAHELLSGATGATLVDRAIAVTQALDQFLQEGMP